MPFGIPKDGFWGKKELAYQHVHMFWAFWAAYAVYYFLPFSHVPIMVGLICGMLMEAYQHLEYIRTWASPKTWTDSLRDLCFWVIGGCLNYIIIFFGKGL